jgi:hypothetical protein
MLFFRPLTPTRTSLKEQKKRAKEKRLKKVQIIKGYQAFIKRFGKWKALLGGKPLPRAKAIQVGEKAARTTLGATFKITPKGWVKGVERPYVPSPKVFRAYRIIGGKKVGLRDTWIQKRGFRLGARSEVREIQAAKSSFFKSKGGGNKWLL